MAICETKFHYQDNIPLIDYVRNMASNMQLYPLEDCLVTSSLSSKFNPAPIEMVLRELTPIDVRIFWESKNFDSCTNMVETWYGTAYSVEKISADMIQQWIEATTNENLHLPRAHIFIPTDLELKSMGEKAKPPILLRKSACSRLWYTSDTLFFIPKAYFTIEFTCPESSYSSEASVLTDIFSRLLMDYLNEYASDAHVAGLYYGIHNTDTGFQITAVGYNHEMRILLAPIMGTIAEFEVKPARIAVTKDVVPKEYQNFTFQQPYQQAMCYCLLTIEDQPWSRNDQLDVLPYLDVEVQHCFLIVGTMYPEDLFIFLLNRCHSKVEHSPFGALCVLKHLLPGLSDVWHHKRPLLVEPVKLLCYEQSFGVPKAFAELIVVMASPRFLFDPAGEEQVSSVKVMCRLCFSGENEDSERIVKMLACKNCGKKYHRTCLESWAQFRDLFHWSCPSCRIGEVCRRAGVPNKFMFGKRCEGAGEVYCYCQPPPPKNVSSESYLCPNHTRCPICGSAVLGSGLSTRWFLGYTCCDACGSLFVKGNYCPVGLKAYQNYESTLMVCCAAHQRWVPRDCDGFSNELHQQFHADGNLYSQCAACRGSCYAVRVINDAVQELWSRGDIVDRDQIAKRIVKFIADVRATINPDPDIGDLLQVIYVPHSKETLAVLLIPSSELSQHISIAGMECISLLLIPSSELSQHISIAGMECISLVGRAVGKDRFHEDATQVMEIWMSLTARVIVHRLLYSGALSCRILSSNSEVVCH